MFIYHGSPLVSCLAPLNPPPRCLLPHSLRLFRLVPHSLRSSRLASRLPSRSHAVPSPAPFSSRSVLPNCRTAFRPSCGRAVLFSSSHRSPHALPSSSPNDRITRAGQRIPPTPSGRASNKRTSRTPIWMIWEQPPTQERLITYPQGNKTNEKETRRASKTLRQDDITRRKDGATEQNETPQGKRR